MSRHRGVPNSNFRFECPREIEAIFKNTSHDNKGPRWDSLAKQNLGVQILKHCPFKERAMCPMADMKPDLKGELCFLRNLIKIY